MVADAQPSTDVSPTRRGGSTPVPAYLAGFLFIGVALSLAGPALACDTPVSACARDPGRGLALVKAGQPAAGDVGVDLGLDRGDVRVDELTDGRGELGGAGRGGEVHAMHRGTPG